MSATPHAAKAARQSRASGSTDRQRTRSRGRSGRRPGRGNNPVSGQHPSGRERATAYGRKRWVLGPEELVRHVEEDGERRETEEDAEGKDGERRKELPGDVGRQACENRLGHGGRETSRGGVDRGRGKKGASAVLVRRQAAARVFRLLSSLNRPTPGRRPPPLLASGRRPDNSHLIPRVRGPGQPPASSRPAAEDSGVVFSCHPLAAQYMHSRSPRIASLSSQTVSSLQACSQSNHKSTGKMVSALFFILSHTQIDLALRPASDH